MRLKTKDGWYVKDINGVCYVTWVSTKDKAHAAIFPIERANEWARLLENFTDMELEVESL